MCNLFGKDEFFAKEQRKYSDDAKGYIDNQEKTQGLLEQAQKKANRKKRSLGDTWEKLQLLFELVKAYSKGDYKNISTRTIITVIGAILYFISPIDLIPDFIIGLGLVDDAAVIGYTVKTLSTELAEFKKWKQAATFYAPENPLE